LSFPPVGISKPQARALVGVIGGSGLYDPGFLERATEVKVYTPYGEPSDSIVVGEVEGKSVAFLPRHGRGHKIPPHKVNYRANLWALRSLGVKWVVSVSAVGSLREEMRPGDFVVPDQFIDMTKKREYTFFEGPVVAHVSMAKPFCDALRRRLKDACEKLGVRVHYGGTYICIEGPRFSTVAESRVWRDVFKADVIGMTLVPEVSLACELQMCYATLAMVTDYDVWAERPVTAEEVAKVMSENVKKARAVVYETIKALPEEPEEEECSCCKSLEQAIL